MKYREVSSDGEYGLLKKLISFKTTSDVSNKPVVDYICKYIENLHLENVQVTRVGQTGSLTDPAQGPFKEGLVIRIGPESQKGGILLSGHLDCVPANASEWNTEPFVLHETDTHFIARSIEDMTFFNFKALRAIPEWDKMDLKKPIYIVLSYDEEVGCTGIVNMLPDIKKMGIAPDLCIVGESTEMKVAYSHFQRADIKFTCHAAGGHPSDSENPIRTNPIALGSFLLTHLEKNWDFIAYLIDQRGLENKSEKPIFSPTIFLSGQTKNQIPTEAEVTIDFRCSPDVSLKKMERIFREEAEKVAEDYKRIRLSPDQTRKLTPNNLQASIDVDIKITNEGYACTAPKAKSLIEKIFGPSKFIAVKYGCEASKLFHAGFENVFIMGPGRSSDAHSVNEPLEKKYDALCKDMMQKVGRYCCAL